MISTVDPDARHAHKTRERRQDGFKAHVVGRTRHRADHQHRPDQGRRPGQQRRHRRDRSARRRLERGPRGRRAGRGARGLGLRHRRGVGRARHRGAHPGDQALADPPRGGARLHHRRLPPQPCRRRPDLPERGHPGRSATPERWASAPPAAAAHCARAAPPPTAGASSLSDNITSSNAPIAPEPPPPSTSRLTDATDPWSSAPSPGSPAATAASRSRGVIKNNAWLHTRVAALNLRRLLRLGLHLDYGRTSAT